MTTKFDTVEQAQQLAARRLPAILAERLVIGTRTNAENQRAFEQLALVPRACSEFARADLTTDILGVTSQMPIIVGPTGNTRMIHPDGDLGVAKAAASAGIPHVLHMASWHTNDAVAQVAASAKWQQVWMRMGRDGVVHAMENARRAGFAALVVTVDSAYVPPSFVMPQRSMRNAVRFAPQVVAHPAWFAGFRKLKFDPLRGGRAIPGTPQTGLAPDWRDFEWIRSAWAGPLVIKGIMRVADARHAVDVGADAIVVSNHGGLALRDVPASLSVLAEIVDAVGEQVEVLFDGGIRCGLDIAKALALGARAVMIARPTLFGLAVGGEAGARRVLEILRAELEEAVALIGAPASRDLDRSFVTRRGPVSLNGPSA